MDDGLDLMVRMCIMSSSQKVRVFQKIVMYCRMAGCGHFLVTFPMIEPKHGHLTGGDLQMHLLNGSNLWNLDPN